MSSSNPSDPQPSDPAVASKRARRRISRNGGVALLCGVVLAGMVGAVYYARKQQWWQAGVLAGLAALTKEPTLLFPAAYGVYWLYQRQWRRAMGFALVTVPFIIWQLVLHAHFGQFGVASGGATGTGFELIPFAGFLRILTDGGLWAFLLVGLLAAGVAVIPSVWGLWQSLQDAWKKRWSQDTTMLFFQALLLLFIPFSTYSEPIGIIRFIVGLQIAVMWYAAAYHHRRVLIYSTLWSLTSLFVIYSDLAR